MNKYLNFSVITLVAFSFLTCTNLKDEPIQYSGNPLLPGDFADPHIIQYRDTFYIYATAWDSKKSIVWYSPNLTDWKMRHLNWPTTEMGKEIWAPCVLQGKDGRFYMYSSTGHQIYAGVSAHPFGPFSNLMPYNQPIVKDRQYWDKMHSIDADVFIDSDGQAYLYYGSGWKLERWHGSCCKIE